MSDRLVLDPNAIGDAVSGEVAKTSPAYSAVAKIIAVAVIDALCPVCTRCGQGRVPIGSAKPVCGPCYCELTSGDSIGTVPRQ
ncbi:MAG: hypothetical protein ACYTEQ_18195 [Planctomycetota bacterium]|jgi:hypothetical protein